MITEDPYLNIKKAKRELYPASLKTFLFPLTIPSDYSPLATLHVYSFLRESSTTPCTNPEILH
jgi:hypothetical protein